MHTQGTHPEGLISFKTASPIKERYLFGALVDKFIVPVEGNKHHAVAVITDCAAANDLVNVHILGSNCGTMKVLAGGPILCGDFITANSSGRAVNWEKEPQKGSYPIYGIALSNSHPGECVEFTPTLGLQKNK